jgi:hypothetical protein
VLGPAFTSTQPLRATQNTLDVGITAAIAALAASIRPGQQLLYLMFSA